MDNCIFCRLELEQDQNIVMIVCFYSLDRVK